MTRTATAALPVLFKSGGDGQTVEVSTIDGRPFELFAVFDRIDNPARGRAGGADGKAGNPVQIWMDAPVKGIDGMRVAEIFLQVDGLEEIHCCPPFLSLPNWRDNVPAMPVGNANTSTTSTAPTTIRPAVWPSPQHMPSSAAFVLLRSRLTSVDTAAR